MLWCMMSHLTQSITQNAHIHTHGSWHLLRGVRGDRANVIAARLRYTQMSIDVSHPFCCSYVGIMWRISTLIKHKIYVNLSACSVVRFFSILWLNSDYENDAIGSNRQWWHCSISSSASTAQFREANQGNGSTVWSPRNACLPRIM